MAASVALNYRHRHRFEKRMLFSLAVTVDDAVDRNIRIETQTKFFQFEAVLLGLCHGGLAGKDQSNRCRGRWALAAFLG